MRGDFISLAMRRYTLANSARSINVASSALARELLTRFETGHRCRKSFGAGFRYSMPASPFSRGSNCFSVKRTGIRSWTSATKPLGSVIIMVQDFSRSPVSRFFHSSHSPAIVSAGDPSRAVKYQGCFPLSACPAIHNIRKPEWTAGPLKGVSEKRLRLDCFRSGVERCHLHVFNRLAPPTWH